MSTIAIAEQLPKSLRIGPHMWKLELWSNMQAAGNQKWGEASTIELTIRVQKDMPSATKLVETLLHEIMHALYWTQGVEQNDNQERVCGAYGTGWAQVFVDNPELLAWLQRTLAY